MVRRRVNAGTNANDNFDQVASMAALQEMMKEELAKHDRANKEASEKLEERMHIVGNENAELKESIKGLTAALNDTNKDDIKHLHKKFDTLKGQVEMLQLKVVQPIGEKVKLLAEQVRAGKAESKELGRAVGDETKRLHQKLDTLKEDVEMLQFN